MSGCQGQKETSFQKRRKPPSRCGLLTPCHSPLYSTFRDISQAWPSQTPTYLLPFLGFIFHGETAPQLLPPCSLPPPDPPPFPLFFFLPGRKLHQYPSSCPSHLMVGVGVNGEQCLGTLQLRGGTQHGVHVHGAWHLEQTGEESLLPQVKITFGPFPMSVTNFAG